MTNTLKILCVLSLPFAAACSSGGGSSGTTGTSGGAGATGGTTGGAIPTVPTLGNTEIDRMGRPAINTALTAPLGSFTLGDGGSILEAQAKDYYNAVSDRTMWLGDFAGAFVGSLAVYDALDGKCGNQLVEGKQDGGPEAAYGTLAAVMTDDELYVDTTVTTCSQYLAVELETVGIIPASAPKDCGGRTLTENVIDETYSALALGALTGVSNGITSKAGSRATTTFPFLGTP